ncbi:MAG: ice-binding family protein [Anaerolineae bacterium]
MPLRRIVTVLCILTAVLVAAEGPTPTVLASPDATAPDLASARSFGVLGGSTVTNTGVTTVTGDVGVSPGPSVTGFPPGIVVNGMIHQNDATAIQAHTDADLAYDDLVNQTCDTDLSGQDLGGMTLTPGSYCFSTSAQLTGILTLDAQSNPAAIFLFQIGTTLTTATGASVVMTNGGLACKVYWQVGSSATLGTGTAFAGNLLADQSITMTTNSSLSGGPWPSMPR